MAYRLSALHAMIRSLIVFVGLEGQRASGKIVGFVSLYRRMAQSEHHDSYRGSLRTTSTPPRTSGSRGGEKDISDYSQIMRFNVTVLVVHSCHCHLRYHETIAVACLFV